MKNRTDHFYITDNNQLTEDRKNDWHIKPVYDRVKSIANLNKSEGRI